MTTNAVPSNSPADLLFNAQKLDEVITGSALSYVDRLGVLRLTAAGAMARFAALNPRGAWVTATVYQTRDLVLVSGTWYIALDTHTSGATFAGDLTAHWRPEQGITSADLANTAGTLLGPSLVGLGVLSYAADTVGGAVYTTLWGNGVTDKSAALSAAIALGYPIRIKGVLVIGTPTTITVPILDTITQIFTTGSSVTISNGLPVRPEWFGSSAGVIRAAAALPAAGGVVDLRNATYPDEGMAFNGTYFSKDNVVIRGTQMPRVSSDCRKLENGTVLLGTVAIYANNVTIENLGVDVGNTFIGGGTTRDGLVCSYGTAAQKAANAIRVGLRLHNVIGLQNGPSAVAHAIIAAEGYTDVVCTGDLCGVYGVHGVVFKASNVKVEFVSAYLNGTEGVIIKSASQTTARASDIQIGAITTRASGPPGTSPYATPTTTTGTANYGLLFHCEGGNVSKVQIDRVTESGHAMGITTAFDSTYDIDSLYIGSIITDANADYGTWMYAPGGWGSFKRVQIGSIEARSSTVGFVTQWTAASTVKVNRVHAASCGTAVAATAVSSAVIDSVNAESCGGAYQITATGKLYVGKTILSGTTTVYYVTSGSGQSVTLSNSWAQVGGGDTFNVILGAYGVVMNGLISSGSTNVLMTLPQFARPPSEKRFLVQGCAGSTQAAIPIHISAAGVVTINDVSGSIANVSNYVSLAGVTYSLTN